eukprot:1189429-Prorocentrum_minimum.AAC.4
MRVIPKFSATKARGSGAQECHRYAYACSKKCALFLLCVCPVTKATHAEGPGFALRILHTSQSRGDPHLRDGATHRFQPKVFLKQKA